VGEHIHVFLGGAQGMDLMGTSPFGVMGRRADRTCDEDLSRAKPAEDEAAAEADEE